MIATLPSVKVSCLLVNYFSANTLGKALQSVFLQQPKNATLQIELDVVVVDNSVNLQEAQLLKNTIAGLQSQTAKRTTSQIREHTRAKGSRARKVAAQTLAIQLRLLVARLLPPVP